MDSNESKWDKLLRIRTTGRDDTKADQYHYPYEPTPYCVLERLAQSELIGKKNTLIDYGCGKGRVSFFLSYQTRCRSIGVEYDERLYKAVCANREEAASGGRTRFVMENAESFAVPPEADCFYFFNPFSEEILKGVLERIRESYYEDPREMLLFFYYPSDEYVAYLMTVEDLEFYDEIDCRDLFPGENLREEILVFEMV